jgi:hypothetical protein
MQVAIISDCHDDNVVGRQKVRAGHLFDTTPIFIGVNSEIEAAGNMIDVLDAFDETEGVVLVNVAPRDNAQKKKHNGTPFGYFWFGKILVVSTVEGLALSLVKKFELTESVNVLDTEKATCEMIENGFIPKELKEHITNSQFRSFDFLPRIAAYVWQTKKEIGEKISIAQISDTPKTIWHIDNFGNCKTTILKNEINVENEQVQTVFAKLPFFNRLKDVPKDEAAIIVGSSGFGNKRFLEVVVQGVKGGSAAKRFSLQIGSEIIR